MKTRVTAIVIAMIGTVSFAVGCGNAGGEAVAGMEAAAAAVCACAKTDRECARTAMKPSNKLRNDYSLRAEKKEEKAGWSAETTKAWDEAIAKAGKCEQEISTASALQNQKAK